MKFNEIQRVLHHLAEINKDARIVVSMGDEETYSIKRITSDSTPREKLTDRGRKPDGTRTTITLHVTKSAQ